MPIKTAKINIESTKKDIVPETENTNKLIRMKKEFYGDIYVILKYLAIGVFFYGLISLLQDVNII
jgi:hypothetical protein